MWCLAPGVDTVGVGVEVWCLAPGVNTVGTTVAAVIDTHVHVVAGDRSRYPLQRHDHPGHEWVDQAPDIEAFRRSMTDAGVDHAVLVQPHGAYGDDNRYTCDAAAGDPSQASVIIVDMTASNRVDRLRDWIDQGAAGIRLFSIPTPSQCWLDDPSTDDVWDLAADHSLTMGVCVLPDELPAVATAAQRHPGHRLVLDHCGFADLVDERSASFQSLMRVLQAGNVTLKVTTHVIDAWSGAGHPVEMLLPRLVDLAGSDRLVWGSDYAQTHDRTYAELVALGRRALSGLSDAERDEVGHTNAADLWFSDLEG